MKTWEDLLNVIGVNKQIISNSKAKTEIVYHIISCILRDTDKVHEYTRYSPIEPISEMSEVQLAELLTIINQHPALGTNLNNLENGFRAGISVGENGNVLMQYSLIGHDRFEDHLNTTLIKPASEGVAIDTQILGRTSSQTTREIYDAEGNLVKKLDASSKDYVPAENPEIDL